MKNGLLEYAFLKIHIFLDGALSGIAQQAPSPGVDTPTAGLF